MNQGISDPDFLEQEERDALRGRGPHCISPECDGELRPECACVECGAGTWRWRCGKCRNGRCAKPKPPLTSAVAPKGIVNLTAIPRPGMRVLYLAHPVSGDVAANVERGKRWLRWAQRVFSGCAVIAPWMQAIEVIGDDDANPEHRERGLRRDEAVVACCDGVILVGGRVSAGMARERAAARHVIDLTLLGDEPPGGVA